MAKIKVEAVVDHLDHEFKRAIEETMRHFAAQVQVDRTILYKFFLQRVYHHCSIWEDVPDTVVKM